VSAKDAAVGTAKQVVAEIAPDGGLVEDGTRQTGRSNLRGERGVGTKGRSPQQPSKPLPKSALQFEGSQMNENQFASLLGLAALKVWPDLPRDAQERLFAAAVDDGVIANALAEFLHDRHPRTTHPPKPTRIA
jgi:hypothetical protein